MSHLTADDKDTFNDTVSSVNACFIPKRPLVISKGPPEYEGLMIAPEGFFRIVYDQHHRAFKLFHSKVAEYLKGDPDEDGNFRFSENNLKRAYPISALPLDYSIDPCDPKLTERQALHFRKVINEKRAVIQDLAQNQLNLNVMRVGDTTIHANRLNSYAIEKKGDTYSAHVSVPLKINDQGHTPRKRNILLQKTLIKNASLAEAQHAVMVSWQATTGATWNGTDIYTELGMGTRKGLAQIWDYAVKHKKGLGLAFGAAGGAYALKGYIDGAELAAAALATYATGHAIFHALGDEGIDRFSEWRKEQSTKKAYASINDFRPDEDAITLFTKDEKGANRPFKHLNENGGHHSDNLCLQMSQMMAMMDDNVESLDHLSPGLMRGVVINALTRAFSSKQIPMTREGMLNPHQSGMLGYYHKEQSGNGEGHGLIHRFVTDREDLYLDGIAPPEIRLPEEQRKQLCSNDGKIQYYTQDTHAERPYARSTTQESLSHKEFVERITELHKSSPTYSRVPLRHTRTAIECISDHFNLDTVDPNSKAYMSGQSPELPDHTAFMT